MLKNKRSEYIRYTEILKECKLKYNFSKKKITFLISCNWLNAWLDYVDGDGPHPGEIDNRALWYAIFNKKEVKRKEDFYVVDKKIWEFLHAIYKGGPILHKEKKEVNSETVSVRSSVTSLEGTCIGNIITDTISQSEFSVINRDNSMPKKSTFEKVVSNISNSKHSSFASNNDVENWSTNDYKVDKYLKGQNGYQPNSTFADVAIKEMPHEEENDKIIASDKEIPNLKNYVKNDKYEDDYESNDEEDSECEQEESEMSASNCEFNIIGLKNPNNY